MEGCSIEAFSCITSLQQNTNTFFYFKRKKEGFCSINENRINSFDQLSTKVIRKELSGKSSEIEAHRNS